MRNDYRIISNNYWVVMTYDIMIELRLKWQEKQCHWKALKSLSIAIINLYGE